MCENRNKFCYICGLFVDKKHRLHFKKNEAVVKAFNSFFNRSYLFSNWYEPEYVCSTCSLELKKWKSGKLNRPTLKFSTPMQWHHQSYHKEEDCYFCQTIVVGHHFKTRDRIQYANVLTVAKPIKRKEEIAENSAESSDENSETTEHDNTFIAYKTSLEEQHLLSNAEYHDVVRDIGLSRRQTETLASRFKQWNMVERNFKITFQRDNNLMLLEQVFKPDDVDNNLVYCTDINQLFACLDHEHRPGDWRLFLDGCCKSLKAVLLHNKNELPSVPIAYATDMKETYATMKKILRLVDYKTFQWQIVSDLKVLTILFGMQGGYTKFPCFFCEWDSRGQNQYECSDWPARKLFQIGQKNVVNIPLVHPDKIILPPLHLKLGYMKQFVKKLDKDSEAFLHLKSVFPKISDAKIKEGVFVGPQIRKIFADKSFSDKLNAVEKRAWLSFISLCENFLGNKRSDDYVEVVHEFLEAYAEMGCRMSIKIHFLKSHLNFFPNNLGQFSDEQGEKFHQELSQIEKRFEGKNRIRMLANYCWSLKRETDDSSYKRKRFSKHF